jgi:hypothetical protein
MNAAEDVEASLGSEIPWVREQMFWEDKLSDPGYRRNGSCRVTTGNASDLMDVRYKDRGGAHEATRLWREGCYRIFTKRWV